MLQQSRGLVRAGPIFCRLGSTSLFPREIRGHARAKASSSGCGRTVMSSSIREVPAIVGGACLVYLVYLGKRPDRQSGINGDFTTRNICTLRYLRNTRRLHSMLGRSLTTSQQHSTPADLSLDNQLFASFIRDWFVWLLPFSPGKSLRHPLGVFLSAVQICHVCSAAEAWRRH